jgi:Prokaryotic homologs of the JAB domain
MTAATPELDRFPTNPVCVFASKSRHEAILTAADHSADGREGGGFVVGRVIEEGRVQIVDHISPWFWDDVRRARTSCALDVAGAVRQCSELRAAGHIGLRDGVIGMWHTHPIEGDQSVAKSEPSGPDRQNALEVGAIVGSNVIVDLILAERRSGSWETEAWITRRDEQGKAVTERAVWLVPERY